MPSLSIFDARLVEASLARHPSLRQPLTELEDFLIQLARIFANDYAGSALPDAVWDKLAEPSEGEKK